MEHIILNNHREYPVIGIGTYTLSPADAVSETLERPGKEIK